mgnify:CR=1 FL=1
MIFKKILLINKQIFKSISKNIIILGGIGSITIFPIMLANGYFYNHNYYIYMGDLGCEDDANFRMRLHTSYISDKSDKPCP